MHEEYLRRIIEDNRKSRESLQQKLSRLSSILQIGTPDEFSATIDAILDEPRVERGERESDELLGEDGEVKSLVGNNDSTETPV